MMRSSCLPMDMSAMVILGLVLAAGSVLVAPQSARGAAAAQVGGAGGVGEAAGQPGRGELIEGPTKPVARFVSQTFKETDRVATFALQRQFARAADLPADYAVRPVFSTMADGKQRLRVEIGQGTSLYGTGEQAGPLLRNGRSVTLWNTDAYGYNENTASLYKSHPWVLAVRADGTAFGVLIDTTWRAVIDLDGAITVMHEGPPAPVYIIDRASPQEVMTALGELTGFMPLPPMWAIGYHQCRYSYFPEARAREVAQGFRDRGIPASVIWFDIDYMDGYRTFTFDKTRFPDPKKLNADLENIGFRAIWMINPGIKDEPGFFVRDQLVKAGFEVKKADGTSYRGAVWPGMCVFPDYTSHDVRAWWTTLYKDYMANGIDGVWNDMNEPAIFDVASKTMDETNQHRGGLYKAYPDSAPQTVTPGTHARFHNVYGMLMSQASYEGILAANPDRRPFVLTRAGHLGSHRYVASWTGDNTANWTDLEQSVPMILNLGLSGWAFTGPDIGGFIGDGPRGDSPEETARLRGEHFARWMGIGALMPFSRGHTAKGNIDKEPWAFNKDTENASRIALQRRYALMPYLYTLFYEASTNGMPVARPVFFADPKDPALRSEDDAFLLGADVLVVPQLMPDGTRTPVLPKGIWRPFDVVADRHPANPDLLIRGGAIVPSGPVVQSVALPTDNSEPRTLYVSLDDSGQARGAVYEDAQDGFAYQKGDYLLTLYTARINGDEVIVSVSGTKGDRPRPARDLIVRVVTDEGIREARGKDGADVRVRLR